MWNENLREKAIFDHFIFNLLATAEVYYFVVLHLVCSYGRSMSLVIFHEVTITLS
jgi:hypothetical protein